MNYCGRGRPCWRGSASPPTTVINFSPIYPQQVAEEIVQYTILSDQPKELNLLFLRLIDGIKRELQTSAQKNDLHLESTLEFARQYLSGNGLPPSIREGLELSLKEAYFTVGDAEKAAIVELAEGQPLIHRAVARQPAGLVSSVRVPRTGERFRREFVPQAIGVLALLPDYFVDPGARYNGDTPLIAAVRVGGERREQDKALRIVIDYIGQFVPVTEETSEQDRLAHALLLEVVSKAYYQGNEQSLTAKTLLNQTSNFEDSGDTAMHVAAKLGKPSLLLLLVRAGANTETKNAQGESAADIVEKRWKEDALMTARFRRAFAGLDAGRARTALAMRLDFVDGDFVSLDIRCDACDDKQAQWACDRCRSLVYCSRECQRQHWRSSHRDQCSLERQ